MKTKDNIRVGDLFWCDGIEPHLVVVKRVIDHNGDTYILSIQGDEYYLGDLKEIK